MLAPGRKGSGGGGIGRRDRGNGRVGITKGQTVDRSIDTVAIGEADGTRGMGRDDGASSDGGGQRDRNDVSRDRIR